MTSLSAYRPGPFRPRSAAHKNSPGTVDDDDARPREDAADDGPESDRYARVIATHRAILQALWRRGYL